MIPAAPSTAVEASVQWFPADPADDELMRPVTRSDQPDMGARIVRTAATLEAVPNTIPLPAVAVCGGIPIALFLWALFFGPARNAPLDWWAGALTTCLMVLPGMLLIVGFVNGVQRAAGPFFVLDKVRGRLELPRSGVTLEAEQIRGIVELRGTADFRATNRAPESERDVRRRKFMELSVLAAAPDGRIGRYPLLLGDCLGPHVSKAARELAEFCGVPYRRIEAGRQAAPAVRPAARRIATAAASAPVSPRTPRPTKTREERRRIILAGAGFLASVLAGVVGLIFSAQIPIWLSVLSIVLGPVYFWTIYRDERKRHAARESQFRNSGPA